MMDNKTPVSQPQVKRILFWLILILIIIFLLIYRLNRWPAVWWDEGWTLDAARHWIEQGHLAHYLDGQPIPLRPTLRLPLILPVALSMRMLGIGVWQGRLPGVLFTIISLGLAVYLNSQMYNKKVGFTTLFVILCLSPITINPIVLGRQVLSEMPMMFYLLGGYCFLWLAITRSPAWGIGAALLFGVALHAKIQVPPFWLVSIALAIWMSVRRRQWRLTYILASVVIGSLVFAAVILLVQNEMMPGLLEDPTDLKVMINTIILVPNSSIRLRAFIYILLLASPQILGFVLAGRSLFRTLLVNQHNSKEYPSVEVASKEVLRSALWGLGASWMVWYAFGAMFWDRYMFPPFYIGCLFAAAYLGKLTSGLDVRSFVRRISALLLGRKFNLLNLQAFVLLIAMAAVLGSILKLAFTDLANPQLASTYLINHIPANARVETYESELFFLAPKFNYHFPPDLVSNQLTRREYIDPNLIIDYHPLEANPDFLVVGPYARTWHLYDGVLKQGGVSLEADVGGYQIYRFLTSPMLYHSSAWQK